MEDEQNDQEAREQLVRDLNDVYHRAIHSSDQRATQAALVDLGLRPEVIVSGELGAVGSLVGGVMGSILYDAGDLASVQSAMLGNREVLHRLAVPEGRREQLAMFLDFCDQQMERLCRPGTSRAVVAALVAIFARTISNVGMAPSNKPT